MKAKKRKLRVGQTVQSIYDATHTFVIDRSMVPERIFREKGSNRWWTRNELQPVGEPEDPGTSFRLNGKGKMRGTHPNASPANCGELKIVVRSPGTPEERKCLLAECPVKFQPKRRWQRFHSEVCRRAHWKKRLAS